MAGRPLGFQKFVNGVYPSLRKLPRFGYDFFPDQGNGILVADVPADAAVATDFGLKIDPFALPDNGLDRAEVDTFPAIRRALGVINGQAAAELGIHPNSAIFTSPQALSAPQTQVGCGPGLISPRIQHDGLTGTGHQALMAILGTFAQVVGHQTGQLTAPMDLALRHRRAGFGTLSLIHVNLGKKGRQPPVVQQDGLGLAVIAKGNGPGGAKMGTDFAKNAKLGVDIDIQILIAGNNADCFFGANQHANVALETGLFVQPEAYFVHEHPEAQLQISLSFPFPHPNMHRLSISPFCVHGF
jgi:hypothetical protein